MNKLALALAATAAFAGQAIAADMPMKAARAAPAPVAVANWTGCYVSGGIGYGLYHQENVDYFSAPPALGQEQKDPTHTANFGVKLQEHCKANGVACELVYPGATGVKAQNTNEYLIAKLKE